MWLPDDLHHDPQGDRHCGFREEIRLNYAHGRGVEPKLLQRSVSFRCFGRSWWLWKRY
jgi:hypothetical protein